MTDDQKQWSAFSTPPLAEGHGSTRPDVWCNTCGPKFLPSHYRRSPEATKENTHVPSS